ncbi:DNA-processing protein DprA [Paenibacillus taichungensis]|uniref:DNA-processing protein DprA n=1 Tax=Paenibacillus taichungensis TaxID=484184 RepID=UPI002DB8BB8C|nr:DNA-processing protein DprA [Paenibacillus taichungensis]MEC0108675.1 DNA-processing protein DprA [Paenibacillus taichungensis]MEC0196175.1 DNA-processing protein DprA [Paenibacillus taichungensis]
MIKKLNSDSYALLLLCSDIALLGKEVKPFTLKQWDDFSKKLLDQGLRPAVFLDKDTELWESRLKMTHIEIERVKKLISRAAQLGLELERLSRLGIWVTTRAETNFPQRYKKILRNQSPVFIYGSGDLELLNEGGTAIVGSRDVDEQGINFTKKLAERLAIEGEVVISGGSRGVDRIAEMGAMSQGGRVVSVLSDSMERVILQKEIRNRILQKQLLVISAYHPSSRFRGYTALERNKHIYGLSNYAIVVAAATQKSGTWSGASENLKNAWVPLFVRESSIPLVGNESLLKLGGISFTEDIFEQEKSIINWLYDKSKNPLINMNTFETHEKVDLFQIVWPHIEKLLHKERSLQELSQILCTIPDQMRIWMETAVKLNRVNRSSKGFKIAKKTIDSEPLEQLNLF